mgnify:CR=1 FL=1
MEETKVVLHESVNKLLSRQGDLDELVEKSKDLSLYSKQFYKNAKKMDKSCCQLIWFSQLNICHMNKIFIIK